MERKVTWSQNGWRRCHCQINISDKNINLFLTIYDHSKTTSAMDFVAHWKNWIRPVSMLVYMLLMMLAIPLCVLEVTKKSDKHVKAWFTGGVFVLMTVPISLWEIILHVINYTQPHLQKYIIRYVLLVKLYPHYNTVLYYANSIITRSSHGSQISFQYDMCETVSR